MPDPTPTTSAERAECDHLNNVTVVICDDCLDGCGGECHTPGCLFWMRTAPDNSIWHLTTSAERVAALEAVAEAAKGLDPNALSYFYSRGYGADPLDPLVAALATLDEHA